MVDCSGCGGGGGFNDFFDDGGVEGEGLARKESYPLLLHAVLFWEVWVPFFYKGLPGGWCIRRVLELLHWIFVFVQDTVDAPDDGIVLSCFTE